MIRPDVEFAEIARDVSASLRYLAGIGCRGADCSAETLAIIRSWDMAVIRLNLMQCRRCRLAADRRRVVCGQGNSEADLVFIGGVPESEDDETGFPYSGPAGELLTRIIAAMNLTRESVYITHAVKCRPADAVSGGGGVNGPIRAAVGLSDTDPGPQTAAVAGPIRDNNGKDIVIAGGEVDPRICRVCRFHLEAELSFVRPRIICALGDLAARSLGMSDQPVSRLRGRFFSFRGSRVMATFSPEHILSHPSAKRMVWEDVKKIMAALAET